MDKTATTKTTMTIRLDRSLREAYERVVKANDRSGSQLIREFMREYIKKHAQGDLLRDAPQRHRHKTRDR